MYARRRRRSDYYNNGDERSGRDLLCMNIDDCGK